MVRRAIELLYSGTCTVRHKRKVFDEVTKRTTFKDVVICENEPCRLSTSNSGKGKQGANVAEVEKTIKLFIRPELEILAGATVTVIQNGRQENFETAGYPAVYSNHQEIELVRVGYS